MDGDSGDKTPLPAPDFCNSWGDGNPVLGKGALGNSSTGHMYYSDTGNREAMVKKVQTMLAELGYDTGPAGSDGKFGNDTEKAVRAFQKDNKDWNGDALKVDGLVGPETSDALNRKMVSKGWYTFHQTETSLTVDFSLLTVKAEALNQPISLNAEGVKKGKIVVCGELVTAKKSVFSFRLHGSTCKPLGNADFRVLTPGIESEGVSDQGGWIRIRHTPDQCFERITIEWVQKEPEEKVFKKDVIIDCQTGDETQQAISRLHNIGYSMDVFSYEAAVRSFQRDYHIDGEIGLDADGNLPPMTKSRLWKMFREDDCDATMPAEPGGR